MVFSLITHQKHPCAESPPEEACWDWDDRWFTPDLI